MAAAPRRLLVCLALLAWCATAATSRDVAVAVDGGTHRRPTRTLRQGRPAAPRQAVPDICGATGQDAGSDTTTRCAQRCQVCVNDRTIATRNRTCLCCKAGFVPNREEPGRCRPCAPSTFSPTPGRARCMLCRGAFTTLRNGATSCDGIGPSAARCCVFSAAVPTCGITGAGAPSYDCANSTLPLPNALYAPASISGLTPAAAEAVCCTAHPAGATCIDIDGAGAGQVALNCTGTGRVNAGSSTSIAGQTPGQARATCCTVYAAGATCGSTTGSSPALPFDCSGTSLAFPNALYAPANISGLTPTAAEAVCCKAYPAGATCADGDGSLTAAAQLLSCGNLVATANATNTTIAGLSAAEATAACCTTAPAVAIPVAAVAAGAGYTCALLNDTSVRCFGVNDVGQLGDGTTTSRPSPVAVTWPGGAPLTGVAQIAAGQYHTCAMLANGTAACWGVNWYGELGDGTSTTSGHPMLVRLTQGGAPLTGVAQIAAGQYHTCAKLDNGTAACWGRNAYGELGDGASSTVTERRSPGTVTQSLGGAPLTGVAGITAGEFHTCATLNNGTAACWGANNKGQLGDGTVADSDVPVAVTWPGGAPLTNVAQIAAGQYHTCATLANGTAACWGWNAYGQLGDGTSGTNRLSPMAVANLTGVTLITAGSQSTCVLASGEVACFGVNSYGQLGVGVNAGNANANRTPLMVPGLNGTAGITAGDVHTCAWWTGGAAVCFGSNAYGQLGRGTVNATANPTPEAGGASDQGGGTMGGGFTWSGGAPLTGVASITAGGYHACATLVNGTAVFWGSNAVGQLGDGSATLFRPAPVPVTWPGGAPLTGVASIAAGFLHTCARLDNGTAACWGNNDVYGQLGDGTRISKYNPVAVTQSLGGAPLTGVAELVAGSYHTCARLVNGTAACWGYNGNGQRGDGTGGPNNDSPVPVPVTWPGGAPLTGVASIIAGWYHTCARLVNGTAACWGENLNGQLGDSSAGDQLNPVAVSNLTGVTLIAAGLRSTCAVIAGGEVACFGDNSWGQLGTIVNAGTDTPNRTPLKIPGLTGAAGGGPAPVGHARASQHFLNVLTCARVAAAADARQRRGDGLLGRL
ncbi:UVR8 [Scenedesmus sp. PABB004]|nr:UVR8 [Scenedesmus sp. PABB004]